VLLDLVPREDGSAGYEVACASSLSSDWAVVGARVSRMEGDDGGQQGVGTSSTAASGRDGSPGAGLMLRIEGVGTDLGIVSTLSGAEGGELQGSGGSGGSGSRSRTAGQQQEDYAGLIDEFERRMGVLGRVVDAAEQRRRRGAAEAEREEQAAAAAGGQTGDDAGKGSRREEDEGVESG
jgi:hypothetical protein